MSVHNPAIKIISTPRSIQLTVELVWRIGLIPVEIHRNSFEIGSSRSNEINVTAVTNIFDD